MSSYEYKLFTGLRSVLMSNGSQQRWNKIRGKHKQTQTFLLGESRQAWVRREADGWSWRDRSRGWSIHAQWAMRGSFLPCGRPFHRFLLPSAEKDPMRPRCPISPTFLSHHCPTAVSGWHCVIIWTHYSPLSVRRAWFCWGCWGCCGGLVTFGFRYVACKLFDGLAVDKRWLN